MVVHPSQAEHSFAPCQTSALTHTHCLTAQVLSAYIQMASKSRGDIEAAVGQLLDLANNDPNNVPVLMALAHGFLLLKQTAKARNQLKVGCTAACVFVLLPGLTQMQQGSSGDDSYR